jgi:hypothetical protein
MGFCDRCNKYRELRFLVSYNKGVKLTVAVCNECYSHVDFKVVPYNHYDLT